MELVSLSYLVFVSQYLHKVFFSSSDDTMKWFQASEWFFYFVVWEGSILLKIVGGCVETIFWDVAYVGK